MGELAEEAWQRQAFGEHRMTNIETGVPLPEAKKKPRGRKPKAVEQPNSALGLINALKFISHAQREAGTPYQTHCIINNHWCVAFDGVLTIGCKVEEDLSGCPNTNKLATALAKCGQHISITQQSENSIVVKSDKFKATIECVRFDEMPLNAPDDSVAPITDEIKKAFEALLWIATEGNDKAWRNSILLQSGSAVACDGFVLLEYWHGVDLPPGLLIPKIAAAAITKIDKKLVGFGYSPENSVTFWYEDGSFIKTQLFKGDFPNYKAIFDKIEAPTCILPQDFYKAVNAVASFNEQKSVILNGNQIQSHSNDLQGATYEIDSLPQKIGFNSEYLKAVGPHFKNTAFSDSAVSFANGNVRGCIAAMKI